jgi:dTDP-4-amino-4,6-dideoxygalactose transaminase
MALNVGPGDLVWTSHITFVASANCARLCGADIDLVDIDPATYNMSVDSLESKLRAARKQNKPLPKVVIVVHLAGQPCDMAAIAVLAKEYGFSTIEDACHAIGARYRGKPVGSGEFSDITVFSFHPVKIITAGEGGMAVTQDEGLKNRMELLRAHGVYKPQQPAGQRHAEPWLYYQHELGFNYRLTDIQAALGLSQLIRLDEFVEHRHRLARRYNEQLAAYELTLPYQVQWGYSSLHLYPVLINRQPTDGTQRRRVFHTLLDHGIGVNVHYIPVHTQPYYKNLGHRTGDYPQAESYYSRAISLPIFAAMTFAEQDRVVHAVGKAMQM